MSSHEEPRSLYKRVMAIFCMHLLERQVNLLSPETASAERLQATMAMLKKVASKVAKLYRDEVDLPDMLHPLQCFRSALDGLLRARGEWRASQYTLEDAADISATSWFIPDIEAEEDEDNGLLAGPGLSAAKKRAQKNLKSVETPSRASASHHSWPNSRARGKLESCAGMLHAAEVSKVASHLLMCWSGCGSKTALADFRCRCGPSWEDLAHGLRKQLASGVSC